MLSILIVFFIYFIELWSFFLLALKTLNKKIVINFTTIGSTFFVSLLFSFGEHYITNPIFLYFVQIVIYLLFYKLHFRQTFQITLYLYAFVFTLNSILQVLTMVLVYFQPHLLKEDYTAIAALCITFFLSLLFYYFVPLQKFFNFTCNSTLPARILFVNLYVIIIFFMLFSKVNSHSFWTLFSVALLIIFSLFSINLDMIYTHFKLQSTQEELDAYHKYLPIVEDLINEVRMHQHNYDNAIQSFAALPLTCPDYESITDALNKYSEDAFHKNIPIDLLKLNYKLVAGFLCFKKNEALKQGKILHITVHNFALQTTLPEYTLMECIGILIDNAMEAVAEGTIIPISIDSQNAQVYVEITNPGPFIDDDLLEKMFQKGYTTKNSNPKEHGLGLSYLYEKVRKYHGAIICSNQKQNGQNYITFKLHI